MINIQVVRFFLIVSIISITQITPAQTVSEFRGIGRTGIYNETDLLKEWPEEGPVKLWSKENLGKGYTSPTMGENLIYITGRQDSMDYITALDYQGNQIWQVEFGRSWNKSFTDTRTIPTLHNGKLYMISGLGEVACHDAKTGKQIWTRNAYEEFSGICNPHGVAESPLIVDDKVFYTPGGNETSMIALNINTGELIWKTESLRDSSSYMSPLYVNHNGQEMIVNLMANILFGVDPANGEILWHYNYIGMDIAEPNPKLQLTNCNTPIYHNGEIFVTKGYNHPSAMFSLNRKGTKIKLKWTNTLLDTHHGNNVLIDGYLYGSTWIHNSSGNWACIDWETGCNQWEAEMNNKGSIIAADGMLYCYDEKRGKLALVHPNPEKFEIISSMIIKEGSGPHWAHPVINDGILYVRHGEVLMAFNIKK